MIEFVDQAQVIVGWIVGVLLFTSAVLTVIRIIRGPSVLNRTLATDVLVTTLICAVAAEATLARHETTLPIIVTLALVAFVGSVSVARFVARDTDRSEDPGGRSTGDRSEEGSTER
ncbi:monovalent cation/H+ antiporter complex subunit F [Enemella evansiae]|uniref:Sodium:proton antiporter n=1 Tax=Enemella evansiae TaxID=2016499 RepID=A0A255GD87_9ACTN|nr:monovalent cation/H+ antiporter complex subunit F [Enemella evansiae]PFG68281.1 multicomponent Na+:H+ antiporter subunit F [Propionibacteriaceae bacterium ES.041]OYN97678.1 sodium:proton antiporter [Enemella evansiae]OYO03084.1 sodium:proton antiporter [Enemella evansiae]OYO03769.1 sodium:proton antiporter [Enemella evansiae]OYO08057.1 sodium:proton antiporter [Enemella evansiae]